MAPFANKTTAANGGTEMYPAFRRPVGMLADLLTKTGLVRQDADYHLLRAAMVVLDDLDGVPVTVTQSPAFKTLTASDTVFENCVVSVQLTVVWPVMGL